MPFRYYWKYEATKKVDNLVTEDTIMAEDEVESFVFLIFKCGLSSKIVLNLLVSSFTCSSKCRLPNKTLC
jgi:hypothetical protein